jgi:hypothetical protein
MSRRLLLYAPRLAAGIDEECQPGHTACLALIAYQELLTRDHPDMQLAGECCGVMASMGIACFAIGAWRFRRLEYP